MFRRCQTGPGGEVPTRFKRRGIDLHRQRQRGDWAHAGDRGQALAHRVGFVRGGEFDLYFLDPGVEIRDLLAQQDGHVFGLGRDGGLLSMAVSNGPTLAGPLPTIMPNSAAWPRSVLISSVRWPTRLSRTFKTMP